MKRFVFMILVGVSAFIAVAQDVERSAGDASVSQKSCLPNDAIFFVETDVSDGVAFLMQDPTGSVWMVSSGTAFQGARKIKISNAHGVDVPFPDEVLVAPDSDLILFRTDLTSGLPCADSCDFEEDIWAFREDLDDRNDSTIKRFKREKDSLKEEKTDTDGEDEKAEIDEQLAKNGKGLKVYKQKREEQKENSVELTRGLLLPGKAVALGPDRIEISALINRDGCGGPVLNKDNEVVGVSSHFVENTRLPSWVTEGTQFEDTRRFALKLDGIDWVTFEAKQYRKESEFIYDNIEALVAFAEIVESVEDDYLVKLSCDTESRDVQKWIEEHNKLAKKYVKAKQQRYRTQKDANRAMRKLERGIDDDLESLVKMIRELEQDAGKGHRVTIPYYQRQLASLEGFYRNIRERMLQSIED